MSDFDTHRWRHWALPGWVRIRYGAQTPRPGSATDGQNISIWGWTSIYFPIWNFCANQLYLLHPASKFPQKSFDKGGGHRKASARISLFCFNLSIKTSDKKKTSPMYQLHRNSNQFGHLKSSSRFLEIHGSMISLLYFLTYILFLYSLCTQ